MGNRKCTRIICDKTIIRLKLIIIYCMLLIRIRIFRFTIFINNVMSLVYMCLQNQLDIMTTIRAYVNCYLYFMITPDLEVIQLEAINDFCFLPGVKILLFFMKSIFLFQTLVINS